jgi:hypothetical protein
MSTATMAAPADPFTMTATAGGGNFDLMEAGNYPAVLVAFIDLGTHTEEFKDAKTGTTREVDLRKVLLVWETPGELKPNGEPFYLAKQFNVSFGPKSAIRLFIEGWRGKKFEPEEQFDLRSILGKSCLMNVIHRAGKGDKKYHEIEGVSAMPKGFSPPSPIRNPFTYMVGSGDPVPREDWIPFVYGEPVADIIERAIEFRVKKATTASVDDDDTDIPF